MKYIAILLIYFCFYASNQLNAQDLNWKINHKGDIILPMNLCDNLPHSDNIEMSGKKVSAIIYYEIDTTKRLTIKKDIIFPQLRTFNKSSEPDWKKYRAYFRRTISEEISPSIGCDNKTLDYSVLDSVEIGGMITFHYAAVNGLKLTKQLYPSMDERLLVEEWQIENLDTKPKQLTISEVHYKQSEIGYKGKYSFIVKSKAEDEITLDPGQAYSFPVYYGATLNDENSDDFDYKTAKKSRDDYLDICRNNLRLHTPDKILNTLFYFAKIRASESIFDSSMGLVHSPGGGNYYAGIWANDQVEYSGPFFPYMGYETAEIAAFNAYKKFLGNIPQDDSTHIAYAFEVDGNFPMTHLDRGDAAMIAYGTSLYLLNTGNTEKAEELWPLIEWCLEYCHRNRNEFGAVKSESDEMEGRIETGNANLSTSSLYYGGLKYSIPIARELKKNSNLKNYEQRLPEMEQVIENYFGATLEGLETYRYFDENKYLRHWICLPLTLGITSRKEGTLKALFEKLWTDNGILVQYKPSLKVEEATFWDRATLYALRGALRVGEQEIAMEKLKQYSTKRLLGDHVPYPVEAYPENNMKHLSAESALYCRIYLEGLLAIEPVSFSEFKMIPILPKDWDYLELENFYMQGIAHNIIMKRKGKKIKLSIESNKQFKYNKTVKQGETVYIKTK